VKRAISDEPLLETLEKKGKEMQEARTLMPGLAGSGVCNFGELI
jgi:hypothetical protein